MMDLTLAFSGRSTVFPRNKTIAILNPRICVTNTDLLENTFDVFEFIAPIK